MAKCTCYFERDLRYGNDYCFLCSAVAPFEENVQHDAHEMMVAVVGVLDDVGTAVRSSITTTEADQLVFGGVVRITTRCLECEAEQHRTERFLDLSVSLSPEGDTSLGHSLEAFAASETCVARQRPSVLAASVTCVSD